ncbi:MAG: NAD(P)H-hydrate epimerase, partial [Acetobacterium sp.]|nr:NAD(P)H-hydrate epimerase [Acetobacterium sp.]
MKVVTPKEMAVMDRHAIEAGTPSLELMERAGQACAEIIKESLNEKSQIIILCGPGNNGGDGLVVGRLLSEAGYIVHLFLTEAETKLSDDNLSNLKKLQEQNIAVRALSSASDFEDLNLNIKGATHIIDAIFGTGLVEKDIPENYHRIFDMVNQSEKTIIAIDIPSGLRGDVGLHVGNAIFADQTIVI